MFAELLICVSIVSFFIIVASYLGGSDKGVRFIKKLQEDSHTYKWEQFKNNKG